MSLRSFPTVSLLVLSLTALSMAEAAERPMLYQFAPPYPQSLPPFASDENVPRLTHEAFLAVQLQIDAKGTVQTLEATTSVGAGLAEYVDEYLRGLAFHPALLDGKETAATLPVEVRLRVGDRLPDFEFPVDDAGKVGDGRLYRTSFALNDITLPAVAHFPSYFGAPNKDTSDVYRYMLIAVDLDALGGLVEARTLLCTYPTYEQQLLSALLWAEFRPAVVRGKAIASTMYLLVSFFGAVAYPTRHWPPAAEDSVDFLEQLRVRTYPDRTGLMSPPIPKSHPHDVFALGPHETLWRDTVTALVEVDSSGQGRLIDCDKTRGEVRSAIQKAVQISRFHPALDFQGKPQKYRGHAVFALTGTPNVRIRYLWLP